MDYYGKKKLMVLIIRIKGIILLLLGIAHSVVAFFEYDMIKPDMPAVRAKDYILWFVGVGIFIKFLGLIDLFILKDLKKQRKTARNIALLASIFAIIIGLTGTIGFYFEPSPPMLILACGISGLIVLLKNYSFFSVE